MSPLGKTEIKETADSPTAVKKLRVVQATWGKFHHFDLARQLEQRGMLEAIFTTYPRFKLRHEALPQSKIHCRWRWHAPLLALWRYGGGLGPLESWWKRQTDADFGDWVAGNLPPCDVLIALSGSGLAAGKAVHRRNGHYICDRGSSHIRWGDTLLNEEFALWGDSYPRTDPRFIAKEEEEYAESDVIIVPSSFAKNSFAEMGVAVGKVRIVPFGVELSRFNPVGRPPDEEFRVLFVGQVSFRKGVPYLLEAFAKLKHRRKKLTIIGAMRPEMRRWLTGRHFDDVEFLGALPQSELPPHMSRSHVHVLASVEEGMALVQAQAMACGTPLISTTNAGAEELISDGKEGFIVPIRSPAAIIEKLELLAGSPELRRRMSEAALARVKSLGGWNAYGDAYARLFAELTMLRRST